MSEQPERPASHDAILAALGETSSRLEDLDDAIDADAAWEEQGPSIPLADLIAELG